jgi:hypothetical protein
MHQRIEGLLLRRRDHPGPLAFAQRFKLLNLGLGHALAGDLLQGRIVELLERLKRVAHRRGEVIG